jgi:hypothetical protein
VKRLFWMSVGAGLAVYGMKRAERAARRWTPEGVAARVNHSVAGAGDTLRGIAADVRTGMAEHEAELRPLVVPIDDERTETNEHKDGR